MFNSRTCVVFLLVFALEQKCLTKEVETELIYIQNGENGIFECPKTSPEEHEVELSDRVSYDPAEGFVIKNFTYLDTGLYKCTIEKNNKTRTLRKFNVKVRRPPRRLEYPEIDESKLRHVIEGQTLRVNCSMEASRIHWIFVHWILPHHKDDRITLKRFQEFTPQRVIGTEALIIRNVSSTDAGLYKCRSGIIGSIRIKDAKTTITVLADPTKSLSP